MRYAIAFVGLSAFTATAIGQSVVNPANGHTYFLTPTKMSWQDAQTYAESVGGNLVTIRNAAEQEWLVTNFYYPIWQPGVGGSSIWIGFTDQVVEGDWRWVSGEPVTYTAWYTGEPNNNGLSSPQGEDYAVLYDAVVVPTDGRWNDYPSPFITTTGGGPFPILCYGLVEVIDVPTPCEITQQPTALSVTPGGSAQLSVQATGADPLAFQWRQDGNELSDDVRISGATSNSLTISNFQASDQGLYDCLVSGSCGTVTSHVVEVSCRASFTSHPESGTFVVGQHIVLTASHSPAGAVTYRWKKDGTNLFNSGVYTGVTTATLHINSTDPTQSGHYTLAVTNQCGVSVSDAAIVGVFCAADFNRDDGIDDLDIIAFFAAFEAGDTTADLDQSTSIDDLDIVAFFWAYEAGC